jgi:hypothetical protein
MRIDFFGAGVCVGIGTGFVEVGRIVGVLVMTIFVSVADATIGKEVTRGEQLTSNIKMKLSFANLFIFYDYLEASQRLALLALGQAWTLLGSRKNSKPEKCLKKPQNPQRPVHAVLGNLLLRKCSPS